MTVNVLITIETTILASVEKVWAYWTDPEHIVNWNYASDTWCCTSAKNDLRKGGEFSIRMEAKDGSVGFDFTGRYIMIKKYEMLSYKLTDGRKVSINFFNRGEGVRLTESFEAEGTNSDNQQKAGWQAILNNFKKYVESK